MPETLPSTVFSGVCFLFLLLAPAFHQLTGLRKGPLWRKGDALAETDPYQTSRGEGGAEQRVSWQLRELSFSTPGTGCTHGLSEPWPQPALDGQSQASAHLT